MQIRVLGSHTDVGQALTQYVEENLEKSVKKYFDNAVSAEVHFAKDGHLFKVTLIVNEGVKGGIVVKSNGEAGDAYAAFSEASEKSAKQLRRYKRKLTNYRRHGAGLKALEPDYKALDAVKYVLPPVNLDIFADMESEEEAKPEEAHRVVAEKTTLIEELSIDEAVMKMDLADLPALVFINSENKRMNVVYHRKDGNISLVDPQA